MAKTGIYFTELCVAAGLCDSVSEARRLVKGHAMSLNRRLVDDVAAVVRFPQDYLYGRYLLLKRGKRNGAICKMLNDGVLWVENL